MSETELSMKRIIRSAPILGCTLSRDDLKKLFGILNELAREAGELQVAKWVKPPNQDQKEFEEHKRIVKGLFVVTTTLAGKDGEMHLAEGGGVLDYPLSPERLEVVHFNSATSFIARFNNEPSNRFEVLLVFKKPDLLHFSIAPSEPTPNSSNVNVTSDNDTWSHGVFQKVRNFIQERSNGRRFLHRSNSYDWALLIFGFPLAFYASFKLQPVITYVTAQSHPVVGYAAYIYVFLASIWIYRLGFNYTKWAFPIVELNPPEGVPAKHRRTWWGLALAIVAGIIVEALY